jgi:hypothetical protein
VSTLKIKIPSKKIRQVERYAEGFNYDVKGLNTVHGSLIKVARGYKNCKQPDTLAHYRQAVCELIENEQTTVTAQWR